MSLVAVKHTVPQAPASTPKAAPLTRFGAGGGGGGDSSVGEGIAAWSFVSGGHRASAMLRSCNATVESSTVSAAGCDRRVVCSA